VASIADRGVRPPAPLPPECRHCVFNAYLFYVCSAPSSAQPKFTSSGPSLTLLACLEARLDPLLCPMHQCVPVRRQQNAARRSRPLVTPVHPSAVCWGWITHPWISSLGSRSLRVYASMMLIRLGVSAGSADLRLLRHFLRTRSLVASRGL
jgi:hypothetical protein